MIWYDVANVSIYDHLQHLPGNAGMK